MESSPPPTALPDVTFRLATRDDLPAIVRLLADDALGAQRELPAEPLAACYVHAFDAMMAQGGNDLVLAVRGDTVVGCVQLTVIPGLSRAGALRGQLEGVRVAASERGQGVGERLVRAAIDRARSAGCTLVQLTCDRSRGDALRFYERLGFEPTHVGMKLVLS
jgi:ribosomal protein S18 acetylase RimI-like enzyme